VGPSSSTVDCVAAPSTVVITAAPSPANLPTDLPELVASSQGTLEAARGSPVNEPLGSAAIAAPANGLEGRIDGSPTVLKSFSSVDDAPSMVSPTVLLLFGSMFQRN
jgi:hypothetical protein